MMSRSRFAAITALLLASGCQYRRDCSTPITRPVLVDPELERITNLAAHGWYQRTRGGEIMNIRVSQKSPVAGETAIRIGPTPPGTAGIYYPTIRTAVINPEFRWDTDVVMHELGHAMGVPHLGLPGSIMHPSSIGWKHDPHTCDHLCCR